MAHDFFQGDIRQSGGLADVRKLLPAALSLCSLHSGAAQILSIIHGILLHRKCGFCSAVFAIMALLLDVPAETDGTAFTIFGR